MSIIVFVRHGESKGNVWPGAYKSDATNFLSPIGVKQAETAGLILKRQGYKFESIVSSDQLRARQTVSVMLNEMDDWQRKWEIDTRFHEFKDNHETVDEHRLRVAAGLADVFKLAEKGNVLVVSHYHTMQRIFDVLALPRSKIPYFDGKLVPNAVPYMYDLNDRTTIKAVDPKNLGPQY